VQKVPEVLITGLGALVLFDAALRVVLVLTGLVAALHYFLMCKAMEHSTHLIRMGAAVVAGMGVCTASCGLMGYTAAGLLFGTLTASSSLAVQVGVWGQGVYVRDLLNRAYLMRKRESEGFNRMMNSTTAPAYDLSDLVTPGGLDELSESERRSKEHA
jgi:hypothetical protein